MKTQDEAPAKKAKKEKTPKPVSFRPKIAGPERHKRSAYQRRCMTRAMKILFGGPNFDGFIGKRVRDVATDGRRRDHAVSFTPMPEKFATPAPTSSALFG